MLSNAKISENIYNKFISYANHYMDNHPFNDLKSKSQIFAMLPHFLGLSQAFPYIQSGSQLPLILHAIKNNIDVKKDMELTSVVGNFLSWEETGGAFVLETMGKSCLPEILQTHTWFHANLLRRDIEKLTGKKVISCFDEPTRSYLLSLLQSLSDLNPIVRVAYMTAFEVHANMVITVLWKQICNNFEVHPDELIYFKIHVGGDDPAEAYHVTMVANLVSQLVVGPEEEQTFLSLATQALHESLNWCTAVSRLQTEGVACDMATA